MVMCIISSIQLEAIQEAEDGTLCISLFHPVPIPPCRGAVVNLGKDRLSLLIDTIYGTSPEGLRDADSIWTNTPWMMVPSSDDFRSNTLGRALKRGGADRACQS